MAESVSDVTASEIENRFRVGVAYNCRVILSDKHMVNCARVDVNADYAPFTLETVISLPYDVIEPHVNNVLGMTYKQAANIPGAVDTQEQFIATSATRILISKRQCSFDNSDKGRLECMTSAKIVLRSLLATLHPFDFDSSLFHGLWMRDPDKYPRMLVLNSFKQLLEAIDHDLEVAANVLTWEGFKEIRFDVPEDKLLRQLIRD
jgi:hypothetical protein